MSLIKTDKTKKYINYIYAIYVALVLVYQITHLIAPVLVWTNEHLSWFSQGLAVGGFILFAFDLITERIFWDKKYGLAIIILIAIMGASSLVNFGTDGVSGLVANAKAIIWQVAQMLVIFPFARRFSKEQLEKMLKAFFIFIAVIWSAMIIISLYLFVNLDAYLLYNTGGSIRQGFMEGRLFGVFYSPHYASVFSAIILSGAVYYGIKAKSKLRLIPYILVSALSFIYIVLSGTRTLVLALLGALFVLAVIYFDEHFLKKGDGRFKRYAKSFAVAVVLCGVTFGLYEAVSIAGDQLAIYMENVVGVEAGEDSVQLERTDVSEENISNNRFEIWSDYFKATASNPLRLIFGNSPGNYMKVVSQNNPFLYIVVHIREEYKTMYESGLIYDTHSAYVGVFVMTGALGLMSLLAFLAIIIKDSFFYITRKKANAWSFYMMMFALLIILIASALESDLFFRCTATSVIFWLLAGIFTKEINQDNMIEDKKSA